MTLALDPRAMLARLVAFPTVSSRSNLDLIDFVQAYLAEHRVEILRVPDPTGTKAALVALIGPKVPGGVVLSGHTDVVPVEGQDWSADPFRLTERGGRLHGRGTSDMKGFDAIALALVPEMLAARLRRPILIALSYDEELGCLGAEPMIAAMLATFPRPEAVIVGEPSLMQVVTGHKALLGLATHVRGHEVHSSLVHRGVSAVMTAARLVTWCEDRMLENRAAAAADGGDARFEPPYTTLHVGRIEGGTAHNITARDCRFGIDIRVVPGERLEDWRDRYLARAAELEAQIRRVHPEAAIHVEVRSALPGCAPEPDGAAEALARRLTGDAGSHNASYATEAGHFQEQGLSTVICGPGSIAQAHQPDEYIALDQLAAGTEFVRGLIRHLS